MRDYESMIAWLQREGLETCVRVPLHDGKGGCVWANTWTPGKVYPTLYGSIQAGMEASKRA